MSDLEHINELNALRARALERTIRAQEAEAALASAQAENKRLQAVVANLTLQAQGHACEADTANATIADAYRAVTGGKGEPGNWRGAEPIKAVLEEARSENERLREALEKTYAALKAVVMMLRDHPAMRGREHVDLGIQANAALNQSERVLAALSNTEEAGG